MTRVTQQSRRGHTAVTPRSQLALRQAAVQAQRRGELPPGGVALLQRRAVRDVVDAGRGDLHWHPHLLVGRGLKEDHWGGP